MRKGTSLVAQFAELTDMNEAPVRGGFPATRHSVVAAARSRNLEEVRVAFDALVSAYWKPVYSYLRFRWRADAEEAKDLTQGFFALAYEKGFFARFEPEKARFRTYVRTCLDAYVSNQRKAQGRLKRGGGEKPLSLDFASAEGEAARIDPATDVDTEEFFRREWVRHVFALAVDSLEERCRQRKKTTAFELFRAYDIEGDAARTSYETLAREHGIPVTQVTNLLAWTRAEFRKIVLDRLAAITGSEREFRAEARGLLGVDPP